MFAKEFVLVGVYVPSTVGRCRPDLEAVSQMFKLLSDQRTAP